VHCHYDIGWSAIPIALYRSIPRLGSRETCALSIRRYRFCAARPDAAKPPVFWRCDARDDHRPLEQRSTHGRVHDHPVHEDTARDDVFHPVQT
jgi:hypothetical protein